MIPLDLLAYTGRDASVIGVCEFFFFLTEGIFRVMTTCIVRLKSRYAQFSFSIITYNHEISPIDSHITYSARSMYEYFMGSE
jgi:hypothetical protein